MRPNGQFAASAGLLLGMFILALLGGNNWIRPMDVPRHTNLVLIVAPSYEHGECYEFRIEVEETYSPSERMYYTSSLIRKENICHLINGEPELVYQTVQGSQSPSPKLGGSGQIVRIGDVFKLYDVAYTATISTTWKWQPCFGTDGPEYCFFRMGDDQESPPAEYTLEVTEGSESIVLTNEKRYSVFVMSKSR